MDNYNIIILSQPRSGSSLLCELFCCFKNTLVLHEVFTDGNVPLTELKIHHRNMLKIIQKNPKSAFGHLEKLFSSRHRVFKIHMFQLQDFDLDFVLELPNTKFLLVTRDNFLEQYVSAKLANMTGSFSTNDEIRGVSSKDITFELDIEDYKIKKETNSFGIKFIKEKLKELNHNYLEFNYEDDLENYNGTALEKIKAWALTSDISLEPSKYIPSVYQKQNSRHMHEIITNWENVKDLI
jgi:LPS sulfotransferase NodH